MIFLLVAILGGEPDASPFPLVSDVGSRDQEAMLDDVDSVVRRQRHREGLAGVVSADGDVAGPTRRHHDQRHAGQPPVPAAGHLHHVQLHARLGVQQDVVREVDRVRRVQVHLRNRHVLATDLAARPVEADLGHVPDRRLLGPAGLGDACPDIGRGAAVRAGRPGSVARDAAVGARIGRSRRRHLSAYSLPW